MRDDSNNGWTCWKCKGRNWDGETRCGHCGTRDEEQVKRVRGASIPGPSGL